MATNKRVANRQHRWLSSVEITGVVLSEPVLADAGNFRSLDKAEIAAFRKQREIWNLPKGMVEGNGQPAWINFILEDFLGLKDKDYWQVGAAIPAGRVVNLHEQQEVLRPTRVLLDEGNPVMLVLEVPREQSLDKPWLQDKGRWKASPTTKFERLLRETGVELGLLTNGQAWRLVVASPSETTSWMTWTVQTWNDDLITLAAFKDLFGESRFFAGPRDQVILELIKQSRQRQLDVADQLGNQVREALQVLVHELDRTDAELGGRYLQGYSEVEVFESSVAFIMRLLFTLYAEENGLLPHGNVTYDRSYGVLHLLTELEETRRLAPEKLKHSYAAYARLLASARLLNDGSVDPDIRIAAHGGQLFDPDRYPLLDGRAKNGEWPTEVPEPPKVRDAVIRDILRSLKYAKADGVRQLVSYRTLAVEQIGHMYEGLLDRRVARAPANQTLLLLQGGPKIDEPEPMNAGEFAGLTEAALIKAISQHTSKTAGTIKKILERNEERQTLVNLGTDDVELLEQAKPVERFLQPLGIVRPGGLYVTQGQDRRSSGAHYTPPTLTEPVVRRTLEHQVYVNVGGKPGLLVEPRLIKTPQEILALKVCDPAMGSGAFLVQATRYLSERLVDAWERMAAEQPDSILTMPFGTPSRGESSETLMPESREERIVFARRYVAERCVYGVDMNRLAVEMAKLSLWLTTLSTDRPFTFVDHALKHGNSLVGLTPEQIRNFTWKPVSTDFGPLFANQPDHEVEEAEKHREAIHNIADHDFVSKEKENRIAEEALAGIRMKSTLAIAAFFEGTNTKQREAKLIENRYWLEHLNDGSKISSSTTVIPFNWEIEFPEIYNRKNPGFDAFLGNPPFLGGTKISTFLGKSLLDWLIINFSEAGNRTDIVAYFLRRIYKLLRAQGSIGLIATNSISDGDTRKAGLEQIITKSGVIFSANTNMNWPGHASVIVSSVTISKGEFYGDKFINDKKVSFISALLNDSAISSEPEIIKSNLSISYEGYKTAGVGFLFQDGKDGCSTISEMERLIERDSKNKDRIFPYLGGAEVNESPHHKPSRFAISFSDMDLAEAEHWPDLLSILRVKVKPIRDKANRKAHREKWWIYGENRPGLTKAIADLENVFVVSRVYSHWAIAQVPANAIFSESLVVFATEDVGYFGVLQSYFHEIWAKTYGSTLGVGNRYTPTDCLKTYPFPIYDERFKLFSRSFIQKRRKIMNAEFLGFTKLYNNFHDMSVGNENIQELRNLHALLDDEVSRLYGWKDLKLERDFHEVTSGDKKLMEYSYSEETKKEILKRLQILNMMGAKA